MLGSSTINNITNLNSRRIDEKQEKKSQANLNGSYFKAAMGAVAYSLNTGKPIHLGSRSMFWNINNLRQLESPDAIVPNAFPEYRFSNRIDGIKNTIKDHVMKNGTSVVTLIEVIEESVPKLEDFFKEIGFCCITTPYNLSVGPFHYVTGYNPETMILKKQLHIFLTKSGTPIDNETRDLAFKNKISKPELLEQLKEEGLGTEYEVSTQLLVFEDVLTGNYVIYANNHPKPYPNAHKIKVAEALVKQINKNIPTIIEQLATETQSSKEDILGRMVISLQGDFNQFATECTYLTEAQDIYTSSGYHEATTNSNLDGSFVGFLFDIDRFLRDNPKEFKLKCAIFDEYRNIREKNEYNRSMDITETNIIESDEQRQDRLVLIDLVSGYRQLIVNFLTNPENEVSLLNMRLDAAFIKNFTNSQIVALIESPECFKYKNMYGEEDVIPQKHWDKLILSCYSHVSNFEGKENDYDSEYLNYKQIFDNNLETLKLTSPMLSDHLLVSIKIMADSAYVEDVNDAVLAERGNIIQRYKNVLNELNNN